MISTAVCCYTYSMLEEKMVLRNYAHLGDCVWELFVRNYTVLKTSNSKTLHKMTTDRVNASFQHKMLEFIMPELNEEEKELVRRGRNLPIPVGRKNIQAEYRYATAFEVLIGYWYLHNKERLEYFYNMFSKTEFFN